MRTMRVTVSQSYYFDGGINESTLTGRLLIIGELLKEKRKCMVKIGILEEKMKSMILKAGSRLPKKSKVSTF